MRENKKIARYFGEITRLQNGRFKIKFVKQLIGVNQYRRKWKEIDTTEFAKQLNAKLITD